jgi:drug/metabolite transporter (DMT)-like permease
MASVSMWTALLEWFRGSVSRPGRLVFVSLLAGLGGIAVLVIHPEGLAGSNVGSLGTAVVLMGAVSWSAGTVLTRGMPLTKSTAVNSGMQMMTGGGLLLLLGLAAGPAPHASALAPQSVLAMLFLTLIGSPVGFTCYLWLLGEVSATRVATYAYANPIAAVFLGWGLAGERLTMLSLAASFIVLAAVVAIVTARQQVASPDHGQAEPAAYDVEQVVARV